MNIIEWNELYHAWEFCVRRFAKELSEPVKFEHIKLEFNNPLYRIYGYDWIHKDEYEKRVSFVTKDPAVFLVSGPSLNKGTLQTAQYLVEAKDDSELLAAIWMYAFVTDLLDDHSGRFDGSRIASAVKVGVLQNLNKHNMRWYHSMRRLLPEDYFSYLYDNLKVKNYETLIELSVISAKTIYNDYTVTLYESYKT